MASTQKALEIARGLQEELNIRQPSALVVSGILFDSGSNPYFTIDDGSVAAGEKAWLIRIAPISWALAKDVLGNTATIFTPHVIQIATEANASGTTAILAAADMLPVLGACLQRGTRVEWWVETTGSAPALTTFDTASKLKSTYDNLYYPMIAAQ